MSKDWTYTIDTHGNAVTVTRTVANEVSTVIVDLDSYATREWTQDEVDAGKPDRDVEWMGDEEPQYTEFGRGAAATLRFTVTDGIASFDGVKDDLWGEDGFDWPAWLRLLYPAAELVENVPGVEFVEDPLEAMRNEMGIGEQTTIKRSN